jgi:hypothetical protein
MVNNKYSFEYNGSKITLKPMATTEILKDLIKVERRKNEPFRKEWAISDDIIFSSKSEFFYKINILQHIQKKEQCDRKRTSNYLS